MFKKITLLTALVLISLGGYFLFVSYQAPNFDLFGDIELISLTLFLIGGILIAGWITSQLIFKE